MKSIFFCLLIFLIACSPAKSPVMQMVQQMVQKPVIHAIHVPTKEHYHFTKKSQTIPTSEARRLENETSPSVQSTDDQLLHKQKRLFRAKLICSYYNMSMSDGSPCKKITDYLHDHFDYEPLKQETPLSNMDFSKDVGNSIPDNEKGTK